MIASASPNLAVPLKITETCLTPWSSSLSLFFYFSTTAGISSFMWERLVNRWPCFSNNGRSASTFASGISLERNDSTTSKRKICISAGKVDPALFSLLFLLSRHAIIVWFSIFFFAISAKPFLCFFDSTCFTIELFFLDIISLQAFHGHVLPN